MHFIVNFIYNIFKSWSCVYSFISFVHFVCLTVVFIVFYRCDFGRWKNKVSAVSWTRCPRLNGSTGTRYWCDAVCKFTVNVLCFLSLVVEIVVNFCMRAKKACAEPAVSTSPTFFRQEWRLCFSDVWTWSAWVLTLHATTRKTLSTTSRFELCFWRQCYFLHHRKRYVTSDLNSSFMRLVLLVKFYFAFGECAGFRGNRRNYKFK